MTTTTCLLYRPRGHMELGFVEELVGDPERGGHICPSKVGGKPIWPDLSDLPGGHACRVCGKPSVMLLQIHAPLVPDDQNDPRSLLLFMCTRQKCHLAGDSLCFQVLRYEPQRLAMNSDLDAAVSRLAVSAGSPDSPKEVVPATPPLCMVCGVFGPKRCGNCGRVNYCCRDHQIHDWKAGHKRTCSDATPTPNETTPLDSLLGVVLPEWDVVTELESLEEEGEGEERSEEERMEDYERYMDKMKGQGEPDLSTAALEAAMGGIKEEDEMFQAFMKRIEMERNQVLRYQRGGEPLFVSAVRIPSKSDIPNCKCGAARNFELQIMPQLLYYLKLDSTHSKSSHTPSGPSIDWGTLLVYTCSSTHCQLGRGYHSEFLWKQEISNCNKV